MIRNIIIAVLVIGVTGTAFWGYQEHQEKNAVLLHAENNYQRAFHNLSYQMDLLHDKIGTALAMNSRKSLSPALADVWRITSEARGEVGQLPLTLLPFNKTEEFLANVGNFSYRTAVRDLDKNPLTDQEYALLKKLYSHSNEMRTELRQVQHLVLENNLRWMDVELALATGKENADNTIIDGFKTVEKKVNGFDQENLENPATVSFQKKNENFKQLTGKPISDEEAIKIAKRISGMKDVKEQVVAHNGKGASYQFLSVNLDDGSGQGASLDITRKGGYPIWFMNHREVKAAKISLNEAVGKAEDFLKENRYKDLQLIDTVQYDSSGLITFATVNNGVIIYPESIKIKVALDNGQVIGFAADDYLKSRKDRTMSTPSLTKEEARTYINPNVKIMDESLAVIVNDLGEEVLCYEFVGVLDEDSYRIYINADDGMEEKVERLQNTEKNYAGAV